MNVFAMERKNTIASCILASDTPQAVIFGMVHNKNSSTRNESLPPESLTYTIFIERMMSEDTFSFFCERKSMNSIPVLQKRLYVSGWHSRTDCQLHIMGNILC